MGKVGLSRGGQLVVSCNLSEYEIWPDKRRGHVCVAGGHIKVGLL